MRQSSLMNLKSFEKTWREKKLIELDASLFNRRITKFVTLSYKLDTRSLRNIMKIKNPLLDTIQRNLLVYASIISLVVDIPEINALETLTCSR